jgi:hypothetical protein
MRLTLKTDTDRSTVGTAFCGAALASAAVMVHEVYIVFFGQCLNSDPFTHVLAEMAIFGPGGAMAFAAAAHIRNRLVLREHP